MESRQFWKDMFLALDGRELAELKYVYLFQSSQKGLRSTAFLNIALGTLTVLLANPWSAPNAMSLIMTIFGAVIVIVSVFFTINPIKEGYLAFSGMFLFSGVWNLTVMVMNGLQGYTLVWGVLGILQLRWTVQYYNAFKRITSAPAPAPSEKAVKLSDSLWDALSKARFEDDSDLITFEAKRARWRGWLLEDRAIFVTNKTRYTVVADKRTFSITENASTGQPGGRATFVLTGTALSGTIDQASMRRYMQWKDGNATQ